MKMTFFIKLAGYSFAVFILAVVLSCSQKGLVSEQLPGELYSVQKLLPDNLESENPTFIVYGDNRPGYRLKEKFLRRDNWYTWKMLVFPFYELYLAGNGLLGGIEYLRNDSGYGYENRVMVRDAIYHEAISTQVDFILSTGDLVTDGRYPENWRRFLLENKVEHPLLDEIPYIPILGSHEISNDTAFGLNNFNAVFAYPRFYTMEFKDADLFILDSNIILDNKQLIDDETQDKLFDTWIVSDDGSHELSWLEKQLASSDKPFKIVSMHHPPISFGKHHNDWERSNYGKNLTEKRKRFIKLLQKYGVQIVLCGHEHLFEHNIIRYERNGNNAVGEIHIVISGGGGVPLRSKKNPEEIRELLHDFRNDGYDVVQVSDEEIFHYLIVSIHADQIKIEVNEVHGSADEEYGFHKSFIITK